MEKGLKINVIVCSIICALVSAVFAMSATPLVGLVWVFFLSFTISNATPHKVKDIPNMLSSQAAGWGWAMVMYFICVYTIQFGGNLALGLFLAILIGSIIMLFIHFKFLMNTWFNNISMIYAVICTFFGTQDFSIIIYLVIAISLGSILCASVDPICGLFLKSESLKVEEKAA